VPEDKLADYIGKEPANRLLESQKGTSDRFQQMYDDGLITFDEMDFMTDSHVLQGEDLDIGGEYHKLIYDQVLTAQAKKIGKKHGAKVEEGNIGVKSNDIEVRKRGTMVQREPLTHEEGEYYLWDKDKDEMVERLGEEVGNFIRYYKTEEVAKDALDTMKRLGQAEKEANKVWFMKLTDKLKQASKDGMPYYVALPPLVMGAAAQRSDAQRQQSKSDAQAILAN